MSSGQSAAWPLENDDAHRGVGYARHALFYGHAQPAGDRPIVFRLRYSNQLRQYPRDEAPAAYKDFNEVLRSVKLAGLASEVARLEAKFVIKDAVKADD